MPRLPRPVVSGGWSRRCSSGRRRAEAWPMDSFAAPTVTIALRGVDLAVLGKLLQQQKADGRAAVDLIQSAEVGARKGAPEPGKGSLVDVVA